MTPEKQSNDKQKQKIIIGILIVVILVVAWQVLGMGGGGSSTPAPTPVAAAPAKPAGQNAMQAPAMSNSMGAAAPVQPEIVAPKQEKVTATNELSKMQQQSQTEYMSSLNKLQMLKLQREIDETKMAIASAELNRMTAEKNIADLITTKQATAPVDSPTPTVPTPMPAAAQPVAVPEMTYNVLSVSYEGKRWTAVVTQGNGSAPAPAAGAPTATGSKLYTVNVGDVLQPDNSMVIGIDKQGVTLKRNNSTRFIPLTAMAM